MKIDELQAFFETELTYPIDQSEVVEQVGSVEVTAPDARETETVSTIIGAVGQESYGSADELFATVIGNVSDGYIGRKFYDDRGGNHPDEASELRDDVDVSF